uniref:Era-like 12S mitochondrial rRNA chaperone 1 n=2 Tax=Cyprinus carpio TaxID=7962 RepID=A0A9R1SDB4_CYPCA
MTLRLCETILRRSLRFSAILKLTAAPEHAPLDLHLSVLSVCLCILLSGHQFSLMPKDPDQPENAKSLKVTIVGAPNAGKSTLTNQLLGRKLFADSEKVHTTRSRAVGVLTQDDTQIVSMKYPNKSLESLLVDPFESIKEADLGNKELALNTQVDLLKNKTLLLDITAQLTEGVVVNGKKIRIRGAEKPHQKSAVKPHNRYTEEPHSETAGGGHFLRTEVLTDQGPEEVCISTIREKLLQCLPKEVPHSMTQQIEIWKESEDGVLDISIKLHVKKELSDSISEAENDVMKIFLREVHLKISAKFRK